ncbi:MAG: hypothetical protein Q4C14_08980, partial [Bacillota bacterium]|nr:hypothetical protein [Bacillota bacterium]
SFTITCEGINPVDCKLKMDKDDYSIAAVFVCYHDGKELYGMKLDIPAAIEKRLVKDVLTYERDVTVTEGEETKVITVSYQYDMYTTSLSWGKGKITKLGKEEP